MKRWKRLYAALLAGGVLVMTTACTTIPDVPDNGISSSTAETDDSKEELVLTLVMNGNESIQDAVDAFNAADNGCRIEVRQYRELVGKDGLPITYTEEEQQFADMALLQDLLNSDEIDLICSSSFANPIYYEILKGKGAFADLYPFMAEDAAVNTETLNQHVLQLCEVNGTLPSLPTFYGIKTLMGRREHVGTKENWTIEECLAHWERMPANATIGGVRQSENVYYVLLRSNLEAFVDYEHAQVQFDSPDFRWLLEFCGSFESTHGEKAILDYEAPQFLSEYECNGFMAADGMATGEFYDDGVQYTLVGYPSTDGAGAYLYPTYVSYAISAKSSPEKQAAAWAFLRTLVSEEYQTTHAITLADPDDPDCTVYNSEIGFPINCAAFETIAQGVMDGTYYGGSYEDKGVSYAVTLPTQEDYAALVAYIERIHRWQRPSHGPLWTIINEESMYYCAGERSLDETVKIIQSRASLWIAEQS